MRHTTCFDTTQPLTYHLKPILCILCHIIFIQTPKPLLISIKRYQPIAIRYSFNINIVNMRHTTRFDTPQPLTYHLCTALKPIVRFLCHITSYTTPLASFNFVQTSSRIALRHSFTINIVNMRHTTCFDTRQPLI